MDSSRRRFLRTAATGTAGAAALSALPPALARALSRAVAIPAAVRTGTLRDVEHIVLCMMENRAFDHYFGAMAGVRGFGDRFPIPVQDVPGLMTGKTVWYQRNDKATGTEPRLVSMQHNDTVADFALMRTAGTPHLYPDAQDAWDHGRMRRWPQHKHYASMVHFHESDLPFHYALANAFTICDANHASFTGGTNPNRCFHFTGTNHGRDAAGPGIYNGPAVDNSYNALTNGAIRSGYTWTTYAERLQDAGVSWQVYQNEEIEFYAMNPLLGFRSFREANAAARAGTATPRQQALYDKGIKTRDLDLLKADVLAGKLPQVSWVCPRSSQSEHPSASSPAQGAAFVAAVLDALTANPEVWSRTALIINFDENDGFFDHVPPPAPPSYLGHDADPARATRAGASTVDTSDDYLGEDDGGIASVDPYRHRPWGLGPRVPMYIVSPWSKGGYVCSQVFDHTSTLRFVEQRFGVMETNISPWRRAVCGDLTSCFNFARPNDQATPLPDTAALDAKSRKLTRTTTPPVAPRIAMPVQAAGTRPSRALPYVLHATCGVMAATAKRGAAEVSLGFVNEGRQGAVFHVYDRLDLGAIPRRYTVEAGRQLADTWTPSASGAYDLWVLGPGGFHRHFTGNARGLEAAGQPVPEISLVYDLANRQLRIRLVNQGPVPCTFTVGANAYLDGDQAAKATVPARGETTVTRPLSATAGWYDISVRLDGQADYSRRMAGRMETGADSVSDPLAGGPAVGEQYKLA